MQTRNGSEKRSGRYASGREREEYIRATLALSQIDSVGINRIKQLVEYFPAPMSIFKAGLADLAAVKGIGAAVAKKITGFTAWKRVDNLLETAEKQKMTLLTPQDGGYPELLSHIYDPPALLWLKGSAAALKGPQIAVVGTRAPSTAGRILTMHLTRGLIRSADIGIVSGLANGVDSLAHRTTLEENGRTVAILGSGVDYIYPKTNFRLARDIINNGGALISEFPPGTLPEAHHFPKRNRLVSGMALGVVLTESRIDGGGAITAGLAVDQNREVFILPHDLRNQSGEGCNELIQRGSGKPVIRIMDILEELPVPVKNMQAALTSIKDHDEHRIFPGFVTPDPGASVDRSASPQTGRKMSSLEKQLCHILTGVTWHIDDLSEKMDMEISTLLPVLLKLELQGVVTQKPGKKFTIREW